jgi:predicted dehydrogenase
MKTILIFDCWLPGFRYIEDLAEINEDVSICFVHTSSLQRGRPAEEYEQFASQYDIPEWVHDFAEFNCDFDQLFAAVNPDAVLVLSLHHLEARTVILAAKKNRIVTFFIPHGIFARVEKNYNKIFGGSPQVSVRLLLTAR